jgi:hypothetical protein
METLSSTPKGYIDQWSVCDSAIASFRGRAALFAVKLCFTGDAPNSIAAMPPLTLRRRRLRRSLEVKPRRKSTAFPQIDGHSPKSSEIMRMEEVKPALWRCSQTHEERSQGNGDLVLPQGAGYPQRVIARRDNMIETSPTSPRISHAVRCGSN